MCARHWIPAPLASGPLYEARCRARLSRRALAERSGVSLRTIKRIELGDGGPAYYATLLALALGLGVEPEQLQAANGQQAPGSRAALQLIGADHPVPAGCDSPQHERDIPPGASA